VKPIPEIVMLLELFGLATSIVAVIDVPMATGFTRFTTGERPALSPKLAQPSGQYPGLAGEQRRRKSNEGHKNETAHRFHFRHSQSEKARL
jgi:hypothetical protein